VIEFSYTRAGDSAEAVRLVGQNPKAKYLGGGTNLVDLMRETVEGPTTLVDVSGLSTEIIPQPDGRLLIGAGAKNTKVAAHPAVREQFPLLARAILSGASAQIRNMATVGGNILQRTRCLYFYDHAARCNKRTPGAGCDAIGGFNRYCAILGASPACVATHPSDMCVALAALDATAHLEGPRGRRTIKFIDLHLLPGEHPDIETQLTPGELITGIELMPLPFSGQFTYRKVRDRASYAFALVSVAAAVAVESGSIRDLRLALGGVAHKPWRALTVEAALRGKPAIAASFRAAAEAELAGAAPLRDNSFKVELAIRTITAVLSDLTEVRR
jgi:xanthine dehydrogenase YagS FAD-binding subunit